MPEEVVRTPVGYKTIQTGDGASCCAPQYLSQEMWAAFARTYTTGTGFSVDLDASVCGQDEPITAVARASFFDPAAGTPPIVTIVGYDPVNNILRVTLDSSNADDGRYVLEITNACGCCALIPIEGIAPASFRLGAPAP